MSRCRSLGQHEYGPPSLRSLAGEQFGVVCFKRLTKVCILDEIKVVRHSQNPDLAPESRSTCQCVRLAAAAKLLPQPTSQPLMHQCARPRQQQTSRHCTSATFPSRKVTFMSL